MNWYEKFKRHLEKSEAQQAEASRMIARQISSVEALTDQVERTPTAPLAEALASARRDLAKLQRELDKARTVGRNDVPPR